MFFSNLPFLLFGWLVRMCLSHALVNRVWDLLSLFWERKFFCFLLKWRNALVSAHCSLPGRKLWMVGSLGFEVVLELWKHTTWKRASKIMHWPGLTMYLCMLFNIYRNCTSLHYKLPPQFLTVGMGVFFSLSDCVAYPCSSICWEIFMVGLFR